MSKKKNDQNMLIPGEEGWDIWSCSSSEVQLERETKDRYALDIDKFPTNKPLLMAFPVRELTALALRIPKQEEGNAQDLVELQIEKTGLAQGEENGCLQQHSYVRDSEDGEQSIYSIDVLKAPAEGTLPQKSPDLFNVSPRCFKFTGDAVTLWKEFGKWVMAISDGNGKIIHYQGFTSSKLGVDIIEDIKFTVGQLLIQRVITSPPSQYIVWTKEDGIYPEGYDVIEKPLGHKLQLEHKPIPMLPPAGKLLPADTRAERLHARRRKQKTILFSLLSLLLLCAIGYAIFQLLKLEKSARLARQESKSLQSQNQSVLDHYKKWDELKPLVDNENSPLSLLLKCTEVIPSSEVRLKRAEFKHQNSDNEAGNIISVILQGEAGEFADASKYDEKLQKSKSLSNLTWSNQDPSQSKTGWGFIYRADKK